jgi:hypothetical protein
MLFELQKEDRGRRGRQIEKEVGYKNNSYSFNPTSPTLPTSIIPLACISFKKVVPFLSLVISIPYVQNEVGEVGEVGRWRLIILYFLPQEKSKGRFLPFGVRKETSL